MPASALLWGNRDASKGDGQLGRDHGKRVGHAPLGDAAAGIDEGSEPAPDRAAHGEPDEGGVDERLDDDAASGGFAALQE